MRKLAREFSKTPEALEFIKILPHTYCEENNLHGFLIETCKDYAGSIQKTDDKRKPPFSSFLAPDKY